MASLQFVAAIVVAYVAALAFFPGLRLLSVVRTLAWCLCSAIVAVSPCLVPRASSVLRMGSAMLAIALLVKLYSVYQSDDLGLRRGFRWYLAWLANPLWVDARHVPPPRTWQSDWRQLPAAIVLCVAGISLLAIVFLSDWSQSPFLLQHCVKVTALYSAVMPFSRVGAIALRLLGWPALDHGRAPAAAVTPADFWRRWNLPAQQFFEEYCFRPAGGLHHPVRATLVTFAVSGLVHEYVFGIATGCLQGWQALFFMIQGVAAVATMRLHPAGRWRTLGIGLTLAFNLLTSVLFFQSVNQLVPFYSGVACEVAN